jgi:hypothetical protein
LAGSWVSDGHGADNSHVNEEIEFMANDTSLTGTSAQTDPDKDLGFNEESPDVSDPQVDPTEPARTENDPVTEEPTTRRGNDEPLPGKGGV